MGNAGSKKNDKQGDYIKQEQTSPANHEKKNDDKELETKNAQESPNATIHSNHLLVEKAKSLIRQGNELFLQTRYEVARNRYSMALSVLKDASHKATVLNNLGVIEFAEGRYEEARKLHNEALQLRKELSGKQVEQLELDYGIGLEGLVLKFQANPDEVGSHKEGFITRLIEHEVYDAVIADSLNNIAACLVAQNQLENAKSLFEESLSIRLVVFGKKSKQVVESLENLATVQDRMNNYSKAEKYLQEALAMINEVAPQDYLEIATIQNNLGVIYTRTGKYELAQQLLNDAIDTREKFLGLDHNRTKSSKQNLAYVVDKIAFVELSDELSKRAELAIDNKPLEDER